MIGKSEMFDYLAGTSKCVKLLIDVLRFFSLEGF